jgi:hypothetical protein
VEIAGRFYWAINVRVGGRGEFGEATRAIVDPKRSFALVPHSLIPTPFANALNTEIENLRRSSYRLHEGREGSVITESLHIKPMFNIRCHKYRVLVAVVHELSTSARRFVGPLAESWSPG